MKWRWLIISLGVAVITLLVLGCRSTPTNESDVSGVAVTSSALALEIAYALEESGAPAKGPHHSLHGLRIYPSSLVSDAPYFDTIVSVDKRMVRRHNLDISGSVISTNIIQLDESSFWNAVSLIARYYEQFDAVPKPQLYLDLLEKALAEKRRSPQGKNF